MFSDPVRGSAIWQNRHGSYISWRDDSTPYQEPSETALSTVLCRGSTRRGSESKANEVCQVRPGLSRDFAVELGPRSEANGGHQRGSMRSIRRRQVGWHRRNANERVGAAIRTPRRLPPLVSLESTNNPSPATPLLPGWGRYRCLAHLYCRSTCYARSFCISTTRPLTTSSSLVATYTRAADRCGTVRQICRSRSTGFVMLRRRAEGPSLCS